MTEYQKVVIEAKKQVRRDQGVVVAMFPEIILAIRGKPFTATCLYAPHKVLQAGKMVETSPLRAKIARDSVGRIYKEMVGFSDDAQVYSSVNAVRIYDPVKQVWYTFSPGEKEVAFHQFPRTMQQWPIPNKDGSPPLPPRIVFRGKPSVDLGVQEIEGFTAYGERVERPPFVISEPDPVEINEWVWAKKVTEPDKLNLRTKHGKPIAPVIPASIGCADLIGSMEGKIQVKRDILFTGIEWDVQRINNHHPVLLRG